MLCLRHCEKHVFHSCFPPPSGFCQTKNWRLVYGNGFLAVQHIWYKSSRPRLESQTNCSESLQPLRSDWPIFFRVHAWPLDTWTHDDAMIHWWLCDDQHAYEVRMIRTCICDNCFRVYLKIHHSLSIWWWHLICSPSELPFNCIHIKSVFFHLLSIECEGWSCGWRQHDSKRVPKATINLSKVWNVFSTIRMLRVIKHKE